MEKSETAMFVSQLITGIKEHNDISVIQATEQLMTEYLHNQKRIADSLDRLGDILHDVAMQLNYISTK